MTLGLRIPRTLISNPDKEIRTIRHLIIKLAPTQIGTRIQTQIDSITKADQATPGTTDQVTHNKFSITSTLDYSILTLNTTRTPPRATIYLRPTHFSLLTIRDKIE